MRGIAAASVNLQQQLVELPDFGGDVAGDRVMLFRRGHGQQRWRQGDDVLRLARQFLRGEGRWNPALRNAVEAFTGL